LGRERGLTATKVNRTIHAVDSCDQRVVEHQRKDSGVWFLSMILDGSGIEKEGSDVSARSLKSTIQDNKVAPNCDTFL